MVKKSAIFLDRDGTINVDKGYTHRLVDLAFEEGAIEGLKTLQEHGYILVMITNQSGIGRGIYTEDDFRVFNEALLEELSKNGVTNKLKVYFCPHHPTEAKGEYLENCNCRKPKTGLIDLAIYHFKNLGIEIDRSTSYVIGDKTSDVMLGYNAGINAILLETGKGGNDGEYPYSEPVYQAKNLNDAADWIVSSQ